MSTVAARRMLKESIDALSYGYDTVRFVGPVRFGDTITVSYAQESESDDGSRIHAAVEAHNQRGELVGVASHVVWRNTTA